MPIRKRIASRTMSNRCDEATPRTIRVLIILLALFCTLDVYYVADLAGHGKLEKVKPIKRIQHQLAQILHKEELPSVSDETEDTTTKQLQGGEADYDPVLLAQWKSELLKEAQEDQDMTERRNKNAKVEANKYAHMTWQEVDHDKEPIYEILEQAGIYRRTLNKATRAQLPTWTHVVKEYGDHPLIYGLEQCEAFVADHDRTISFFGIAGTFNSGTNLLAELLIQNCQISERMEKYGEDQRGIRWQVPWGKHTPVQFREKHVTTTDHEVPLENSFPMITIRDPYSWLLSMCRHPYAARWVYDPEHCPNVINYQSKKASNVYVFYKTDMVSYKSLPEMWNKWYQDYLAVDFPRVLVRFEDLLFFGKEVTETLCACGGGVPRREKFVHIQNSAKLGTNAHGFHKTGLVQALIQYGHARNRTMGMSAEDIDYTKKYFDEKLMEMFNYHHP